MSFLEDLSYGEQRFVLWAVVDQSQRRGEPPTLVVTRTTGEIRYACGMDMVSGVLLVQ